MIASHYAEPLPRQITSDVLLMASPSDAGEAVGSVAKGELFDMLDNTRGWAWGYAGRQRRVGYIRAEAVGPL